MESSETERAYTARSQDTSGTAPEGTPSSGKTFGRASEYTRFQLDALTTIAALEGESVESYGLEIKRRLEEYTGGEVNHGRLYPNLDQLVDDGLLSKSSLDKRTNEYTLTESGRELLRVRATWIVDALEAAEEVSR